MMFQAMPKIRSAPAMATTHVSTQPRANSSSTSTAALPSAASDRQPPLARGAAARTHRSRCGRASRPNQPAMRSRSACAATNGALIRKSAITMLMTAPVVRLPARGGGRSPQRMQRFDAGRDAEQPADAGERILRRAERHEQGEQRQAHRHDGQRRDGSRPVCHSFGFVSCRSANYSRQRPSSCVERLDLFPSTLERCADGRGGPHRSETGSGGASRQLVHSIWRTRWPSSRRSRVSARDLTGALPSTSIWRGSIASTAPARSCWRGCSIGWTPTADRTRIVEDRNPEAARLIALYRARRTATPAAQARSRTRSARIGAMASGCQPRPPTRSTSPVAALLPCRKAVAAPRSVDWRSLPRLLQEIGADALARHERRQPAGRRHHRVSRRLAARALRRRRLRPRARRRRALPRARAAGHRDRRGRPIGRRPRLGDRHDEGVGGDRRPAVDGVRPGEMAGRAALSRARRRRAAPDLGRRRAGPRRRPGGHDRHHRHDAARLRAGDRATPSPPATSSAASSRPRFWRSRSD